MVKTATTYDSRLLLNLVKAEKEVQDAFKGYTNTCEVANNALNGWAAADTGDSPDVLTVSNKVCELFDEAFDAQKTYLISLANYRSSLKDVAAREAEIRIILRDRDIFVSRVSRSAIDCVQCTTVTHMYNLERQGRGVPCIARAALGLTHSSTRANFG